MDVATFLTHYPEFGQTDQGHVQAKLNEAAARMGGPDPRVWGSFATSPQPPNLTDMAQGALAAAFLDTSPFGTETRLAKDEKTSTYWVKWEEYAMCVTGGVTVAGLGLRRFCW